MELTRPFAENGDRQDFPVDTQGNGSMSLQQGFGAFYGLPPEEGGLFIQRPQFNQLMYLVSKGVIDNKTDIKTLKSEYGSLSTSSVKLLTQTLKWTVGTGGKFTKISDALNEVLKYHPAKIGYGNYPVVLTLKNGFIMDEQIKCIGTDLGFVSIETEIPGAEVIVENSAIQTEIGGFKTAFYASNNGVLPTLNFKCKLRTPNEKNTVGFGLRYGGKIILTSKSEFSDFDIGCYLGESSNSSIISSSYKRNNIGIKCWKSFVDASYVTIDGSKTNSVEARNCLLMMESAKLLNQTKGTSVINCSFGATVSATGSDKSGSTVPFGNITNNQITSNGLIVF